MGEHRTRVLWVTFHFPPRQSSGVYRPIRLYQYLNKTKFAIDFLTLSNTGKYRQAVQDHSLLSELQTVPSIFRVPSFEFNDIRRRIFGKSGTESDSQSFPSKPSLDHENRQMALQGKMKRSAKQMYRLFLMVTQFPDQYWPWGVLATVRAVFSHVVRSYDVVYTTSNPQSGHFPGLVLRMFGVKWIADYRDGGSLWNKIIHSYPKGNFRQKLEHWYQRLVLQRADFVITQSETLKKNFSNVYGVPESKIQAIPNGYEESDFSPRRSEVNPLSKGQHELHVVHVGVWYLNAQEVSRMVGLLNDFHRVMQAHHEKLVFHAIGSNLLAAHAKQDQLQFDYRHHGIVPHPSLPPFLFEADCFLLCTSVGWMVGAERIDGVLAGKLWEYLRGNKPILLFGPKDEAWEIVEKAGVGMYLGDAGGNSQLSREKLRKLIDYCSHRAPNAKEHSWESRAKLMEHVLEHVLS